MICEQCYHFTQEEGFCSLYKAWIRKDLKECKYLNKDLSNEIICMNCKHYIGGGDFNLCCDIRYGLCYFDTKGCEKFEVK